MEVKKAFWKNRSVLVTGGSGFVGYWLASTLASYGSKVHVLDPCPLPSFSVIKGLSPKKLSYHKGVSTQSALVTKLLREHKIQTIFHLGAEAIVSRANAKPAHALTRNIQGTWVLLEAARSTPVTEVVVASTDHAYGQHTKLPFREDYALRGEYPYDVSKSCTDLITRMYAKTYGLPTVIARCGNIYGGGDMNGTRLIPDALRVLHKEDVFSVRSSGKFLREYVYITDAVSAYIALAEQLQLKQLHGEAFNFAAGKPLSVLGVLDMLGATAKKPLRYEVLNTARHEILNLSLDATKARRTLGWKPNVDHKRGLALTERWYRDYFTQGGKLQ